MSQPARRPYSPETIALKLLVLALAAVLWSHGLTTAAVVLAVLAVLSYWRVRQVIRYGLAVAAMALIRAWVVRRTKPYADELGEPGSVTDLDAPWLQWLNTRCPACGV